MEQLFEKLLSLILSWNASDIHFEIKDRVLSVEARTAYKMQRVDNEYYSFELIEYLKYQANIDLSNPQKPQSGSFHYYYEGFEYYFRLACIKTVYTESIVLRILNKLLVHNKLSILKKQNSIFSNAIERQTGLILLSGPTGSGKTTSLYNLLSKIKDKKIYTIEDPIEIYFDFLVQLQVNKSRNFGYDEGLKQILRHDPDVIVIGEIRDEIEARMAIRCSLTGHLVIASIHSKSTLSSLQRMLDFGVNRFDLFETLILVSNQRLIPFQNQKRIALYELMEQGEIEAYAKNQYDKGKTLSIEKQMLLLKKKYKS